METGIGKSARLEYLAGSASNPAVVHAVGVESEMGLVFAARERGQELT